ncbi:MAG: SpoIIE family protein phosphatase [Chlorobi bacterium]|nr:SpoIIE family protein phosphatase [Chlorobiota bacterium]
MEDKFQKIVRDLGEGIVIVNFKEEFIFANSSACKIFDVPNGKLINKTLKDFVDDEEWKKVLNQTSKRKIGEPGKYHLEINTNNHNKKMLLVTAKPEYNESGEVIDTVAVFFDITENINEHKKLKEFNQQFEELEGQLFEQAIEADIRKKEAEKLLKHFNDSINYAKTIQYSLLPSLSHLNKMLTKDVFVLYKPKHTIGGDFYYMKRRDDSIIFAVADCTGHGVSGALISMLGITFLNDIIDQNLLFNSSEILSKLRKKIKHTFKEYGNDFQNKNGMDIALCIISLKTNMMQFSGAFNPLYIIRNNELTEYKATKNPIAYYPVEKEFESHNIQLFKNDTFYLFSDGFQDQLGGESEKKYSKKKFREFLLKIHKEDMTEQKKLLEKEFVSWQSENDQVDDMTVMGVKWD